MTDELPWRRWMEIGLGHLGLTPAAFWGMSLSEWAAALAGSRERLGAPAGEALTRGELEALRERFPD